MNAVRIKEGDHLILIFHQSMKLQIKIDGIRARLPH